VRAIDVTVEIREEAARVCDETARMERGERSRLRCGSIEDAGEFSDSAFGLAGTAAKAVADALRSTGKRFHPSLGWSTAGRLLRAGWSPGQQIVAQEVAQT
jgi:hypothetical protein